MERPGLSRDIIECIGTVSSIIASTDYSFFWPVRPPEADSRYSHRYASELIEDLKEIERRSLEVSYTHPSTVWLIISRAIRRIKDLEKEDRIYLLEKLLSIVKKSKSGDIFNRDGSNIVLDQKQVGQILEKREWKNPKKEENKTFHRLSASLWAYFDSIYPVMRNTGIEIHGPYKTEKGWLLVRSCINMRPGDLWRDTAELPYDSVTLYSIYDCDCSKMKFDVFNNLTHSLNLPASLIEYSVTADDQEKDLSELNMLSDLLGEKILNKVKEFEKMNKEERIRKYAEIMWYMLKPMKNALGKQIRVPDPEEPRKEPSLADIQGTKYAEKKIRNIFLSYLRD